MRVEPMRWWHISQVAQLEEELFPGDRWSVEQFWGELAQPTRHYVVAIDGEDVIGYAGVFVLPPSSDVQTIAVSAQRQGGGVGAQLLDSLVTYAMNEGARELMLEVRSDNEPAIAMYSRRGFERISRRRGYYPDGGDADIMRRLIEAS